MVEKLKSHEIKVCLGMGVVPFNAGLTYLQREGSLPDSIKVDDFDPELEGTVISGEEQEMRELLEDLIINPATRAAARWR